MTPEQLEAIKKRRLEDWMPELRHLPKDPYGREMAMAGAHTAWTARQPDIRSLIDEVERMMEEIERLESGREIERRMIVNAGELINSLKTRVAKLEKVREAAVRLVRPGEPFEPALISLWNTLAEASE